jgi:hypothetical protein
MKPAVKLNHIVASTGAVERYLSKFLSIFSKCLKLIGFTLLINEVKQ